MSISSSLLRNLNINKTMNEALKTNIQSNTILPSINTNTNDKLRTLAVDFEVEKVGEKANNEKWGQWEEKADPFTLEVIKALINDADSVIKGHTDNESSVEIASKRVLGDTYYEKV